MMTTLIEKQAKTGGKQPKGPRTPAFIQTIQGIFWPIELMEATRKRYGDLFTARSLGFPPMVLLSHPEAIEQVFSADPSVFEIGPTNKFVQPLLGEQSMLQLDGRPHQRQRKLLMPPFHGQRMRAYGELICEITQQVMSEWKIGQPFCIHSYTQEISLEVILRAVFGLDEGERSNQLKQKLRDFLDTFQSPWRSSLLFVPFLRKDLGAWSPWGRFLRQKQEINELLTAEIRDRKTQVKPLGEDILSLMLSARDEDGEPLSEAELRDELMTLLFAGHETTATALAWAFYWIHSLPEVREKVLTELDAIAPDTDKSAIVKLPYLGAVCSETLRIYPVVLFTFARVLRSPLEIMGYQLQPGTMLAPCIYLTHHREDIYPESKQFKPERFLERQFSPYEYFPFGGAPRTCIGYAFAPFEMKLVLATVLSQVQLELLENRPVRPARRGIIMSPAGGVRMVMTSRR